MANLRRTYSQGRMQLDIENRLLPDGEYREAFNAVIYNNESKEEGSVKKGYSNKKLTNLDLGLNPKCILGISHPSRNRVYWGVVSDSGSYLIEYDFTNEIASFVLKDTRLVGSRVFDLKEDFLCTGVEILSHDDIKKELFLMTDDNMQPLCFNIERAKTWPENGFEKEDILLIKKPPRYAPIVTPVYTSDGSNNLEDKFLTFSYRYKYLDGEYSALSSFTNYCFYPNKFELDFQTMENNGMSNIFNGIKIDYNTGDKRVIEIQLVFKESNSNTIYLIETFNKSKKGFGDNEIKSFIFSNNKIFISLPERELYRSFDNVPLKAKAFSLIGNRAIFGNYQEFFDIKDINYNDIVIDYDIALISKEIKGESLDVTINNDGKNIIIDFSDKQLKKGTGISLNLKLKETTYNDGNFEENIYFVLNKDYVDAIELAEDDDFVLFVENTITNLFLQNYDAESPDNSELSSNTNFNIISSTSTTIIINAITLTYTIDDTHDEISIWEFETETNVFFEETPIKTSLKTIRSYEIGFIYLDEFNRSTTTLTKDYNTINIPIEYAIYQNKIQISINHLPPYWADRYKIVVKENRGEYQTIYVNVFYEDGLFRWIKLEGANKDKIKENDILVVKSDLSGPLDNLIKVKVLELKEKIEDFIEGNANEDGADIIEEEGLYFKIKPVGFDMSFNSSTSRTFEKFNRFRYPWRTYTSPLFGEGTPFESYKLSPGSTVRIFISFVASGSIEYNATYDKRFRVQGSYNSVKEWFEAEVENLGSFGQDYTWDGITDIGDNISEGFGLADEWNQFSGWGWSNDNNSFFVVPHRKGTASRDIRTTLKFEILFTKGVLIFETLPKDFNSDIFYETEETFDIINGEHHGSLQHQIIQNQNNSTLEPAIIELSFFNCYTQGNGAESYRYKDVLTEKYLNIDLRPSTTTIEPYKQVRRFADLTYSEPYVESSGINGLNVFNLSTANFKDDLDKQFGSIQKLHSRENDIVVLQEDKAGKVLFEKKLIYTADGNSALTATPNVLNDYIPYKGNRGIGKNPESFSVDDYGRIKYASVKTGSIIRLSIDGIEDIVYGVRNFFRDLFINRTKGKIISGYDPYLDLTTFTIEENITEIPIYNCGNEIVKNAISLPFTYTLQLNSLTGEIVLNYNITSGTATIELTHNSVTEVVSGVSGIGNIIIERTDLSETTASVTITPVTRPISFSITNSCPIGIPLDIILVVINDQDDLDKTIVNRFRSNLNGFIQNEDLFTDGPITRFETLSGFEGQNLFPTEGSVITMQSVKGNSNTGSFLPIEECNRIGYLISHTNYTESILNDLLDDANYLTLTETTQGIDQNKFTGNFVFSRPLGNEKLYLIWDYSNRSPIANDDYTSTQKGTIKNIVVLSNDYDTNAIPLTVTIITPPTNGTAIIEANQSITYTHNNSDTFSDVIVYQISNGTCSSIATVYIDIAVSCDESFNYNGSQGVFEFPISFGTSIGQCGITYQAYGIPDQFEIFYDGVLVATTGGLVPGGGNLLFEKTNPLPTTAIVKVTATNNGTAWAITGVCPNASAEERMAFLEDEITSKNLTEE